MDFDLDQRTASLSVGEFAGFTTGPRDATGGPQGIWRAQLGTHWHNQLRAQATSEAPNTEFEIPISGRIAHHGWTLTLTGRIDQRVSDERGVTLREIKTVTRELPADESELRAAYPDYFAQLAAYRALSNSCHPIGDTTHSRPQGTAADCHLLGDTGASRPPATRHLLGDTPSTSPGAPRERHLLGYTSGISPEGASPECHPIGDTRGTANAGPGQRPRVVRAELVFVEVASGLAQTLVLTPADDAFFRVQLERVAEFLDLRLRARERLRHLAFRPAFAHPRPGQETTQADLTAMFERRPLVLFEAPTGFGKTGVLLEFALGQLRRGHFDRALYLTSKSTGQLQVVRTLTAMTAPSQSNPIGYFAAQPAPAPDDGTAAAQSNPIGYFVATPGGSQEGETPGGKQAERTGNAQVRQASSPAAPTAAATDEEKSTPETRLRSGSPGASDSPSDLDDRDAPSVAVWHVRNKSEHCVNHTFHCVRDNCAYLADAAARWPASGLARFYLDERHARDLETLRAAGRAAKICPYEITRAALAFNDVWIGDYNYVFSPRNRGLFFEQPGFSAARTLLLIDEAHNLPSRVADVYSHVFTAADAFAARDELNRIRPLASLVNAWGHWCHFLDHLRTNHGLSAGEEDDARHLLAEVAKQVGGAALDFAELGPRASELLWEIPSLVDELETSELPRLWWSPRDGELALTCLDAAKAIGATLREFGGVVLASATLTPVDGFVSACGLDELEPAARQPGRAAKKDPVQPARSATPPAAAGPSGTPTAVPDRLGALTKRDTKKLYRQLTSAAELLRVEEERDALRPAVLRAHTPWRDGSYEVAYDARVDTSFQHRSHHYTTTAATIAALHAAASTPNPAGTTLPSPPLAGLMQSGANSGRGARSHSAVGPSLADGRDISLIDRDSRLPAKGSPTGLLHAYGFGPQRGCTEEMRPSPGAGGQADCGEASATQPHSAPDPLSCSGPQPSTLNPPRTSTVAVFFPSYAYADAIQRELTGIAPKLRVALQPRVRDLAAQSAWVEASLQAADALFLVLGSSFAESIDVLGGRVERAMVVGPALPEVNPVQRARLADAAGGGLSRDAAVRRVYQIPGMTKVNQALGRLVRAPGHRARVLLHCRRFLENSYAELLAPDYRGGTTVRSDAELADWLAR